MGRQASSNGSVRTSSPRHSWKLPRPPADSLGGPDGFELNPKLGTVAVIAMVFFNVSGGPWGSEDIFSSSCPSVGLLGIALFTVCWCIPQILVTSEMSCALPSNGGYSIWVREAFGDFWCFQETYWQWVSGVFDAAIFPVLICDSVLQMLGVTGLAMLELWILRALTTVVLSVPTFVSISRVPKMLTIFAIATSAPVLIFVVHGSLTFDSSVLDQGSSRPWNFGQLVNVLFWNMEGWDCISTCTALCEEPREKTIPRGLFAALVITVTQYASVLLVAASIGEYTFPWQTWNDGTLPTIGQSLGTWMAVLLLWASFFGNAGQYLSEFMEGSYLLQGAAEIQIVPRFLGRLSPKTGAPYMANLAQLAIIMMLLAFDFSDILVFDNFFCASAVALEFAAFIVLRVKRPDMNRPFRVPTVLLPLLLPAMVVIGLVWWHCLIGSWRGALINISALLFGVPFGCWVAHRSRLEHSQGIEQSTFDHWIEDD